MSKAALALVGLIATVGIGLAVASAEAKPKPPRVPTQDDPDAEDGEVQETPDEPPTPLPPSNPPDPGAGGPGDGSGPGEPDSQNRKDLLNPAIRDIDLSGQEHYSYNGQVVIKSGSDEDAFDTWIVANSLNGMMMHIFQSVTSPENWIAMFVHPDPPPSDPPAHYIVYKVSNTPYRDWMLQNIFPRTP